MTNAELIEHLKKLPLDLEVVWLAGGQTPVDLEPPTISKFGSERVIVL